VCSSDLGNNVRIVDAARVPERPFKPKKGQALLLGLLAGMVGGLLLAFAIEAIDQSIRTQEDVEERLRLPFLGLIPLTSLRDNARVFEPLLAKELSLTSDAMRNLRTMVDFAGVGQKAKAMLVTSSVQGEGKTYVASNLAVVFSQLGENVLLISGDLRRPQIHKNFGVSNERGLCDFLVSGKNVTELNELAQSCDVPNLKVLNCGTRPPNPSELLNTPRLAAVVAWAKTNFDRVIVDCTPMFPINDTLLWGRHVPSSVFVVGYGATRTPLIRNATQKMLAGGMSLLGVVVNRATPRGLTYASYGHYYHQYYHSYYRETADSAPAKTV
jgi:capsular exopolysaccharide synthesis family protein